MEIFIISKVNETNFNKMLENEQSCGLVFKTKRESK